MSSEERQPDGGPDAWEACPEGELTQMVRRLDASQRWAVRKQVYTTALISTGVFACIVFAVGSLWGPDSTLYGRITCRFCRDHFSDYQLSLVAGALVAGDAGVESAGVAGAGVAGAGVASAGVAGAGQDAALLLNMKTHLEKCTFCRSRFNDAYPDHRIAAATLARPLVAGSLVTGLRSALVQQPMFAIGQHPSW
jgi:hypothetical protein